MKITITIIIIIIIITLQDATPEFSLYGFFIFVDEGGLIGIIGAVEIFNDGFFFFLEERIGESGAKIGDKFNELFLRLNFGVDNGEFFLLSESTSILSSFCLLGRVEIDTEISWDKGFTNFNNTWTGISLWSLLLGIIFCINILGI